MNFKDMPELGFQFGYPTVLTIMFTLCAILYWRFRRNGWL
jgi:magnesium transporter